MLIALGRGDKYRLQHIRESLESGKELFISDKEFLQDLVKTYLKDRIYQAKIVSTSEKPKPETTPEPETKLRKHGYQENAGFAFADSGDTFEIPITKSLEGFTFTDDGDIGETSTRKSAQKKPQPKKKSRQQELEEYEKKYLNESETKVTWKAYDVKAKRKVEIQNPKAVKMKNGKWAVKGTSPITGIKVFRIVGNEKPAVSAEKTADSPKAKKEPATPAEKPKGSQKTEPEVFSRYYRSPEAESPKVKKSKSKKPNPFCEECGSKIAAKDMFCINCGAKR